MSMGCGWYFSSKMYGGSHNRRIDVRRSSPIVSVVSDLKVDDSMLDDSMVDNFVL